MNDKQIECFIRAAETLSFTDTARELFTTQPTVSRLINGLEDELGFQLFFRDRKTVDLTPAGSLVYKFFKKFKLEFNECVEQAKNIDKGYEGQIRMGFNSNTDIDLLWDKIIPSFQKKYPSICFSYACNPTNKELSEKLINENYDVVISVTDELMNDKIFQTQEIIRSRMCLACGKNHPLASKGFLDPKILEQSTIWTVFSEDKQNDIIRELYKYLGVSRWNVKHVEHVETLLINVRMGNGIFFVDPVTKKLNSDNFAVYPLPEQYSQVTFSAVWKKNNISHSLSLFLEFLYQNLKKADQSE